MARAARQLMDVRGAHTLRPQLACLNFVLFDDTRWGLCGNTTDYHDLRNSFINQVLKRRRGLPILLCVIFLSVAHRLQLPVVPLAAPGHFLVMTAPDAGPEATVIDPYHQGRMMSLSEACDFLQVLVRGRISESSLLACARAPRPVQRCFQRMVSNVQGVLAQHPDLVRG